MTIIIHNQGSIEEFKEEQFYLILYNSDKIQIVSAKLDTCASRLRYSFTPSNPWR